MSPIIRYITCLLYTSPCLSAFYLNSLDNQKADKQGVWYATAITEIKDDNEVDVTIPGDKANYIITSVGSCQGIRKVMRKTYIFGDDGGTGGGDSVGEEVLELRCV